MQACTAAVVVKDANSGVEFPLAQKFWEGETFRCLGAGTRSKKILFLNVKVYSAALYVEADRTAKELGIRSRGGFFENDDDYCQALLDGAFNKVLKVHFVRDIEGTQFSEALDKHLLPRMQMSGDLSKLEEFKAFFGDKKLNENSEIALFWNVVGDLEVALSAPTPGDRNYAEMTPQLRIRSQALCRSLFETFVGENTVVTEARAEWVKGAKLLLESDTVNRSTRKGGSG
ncbi:MAG: hypothetical protein WDW36_002500 [Sanguina aurantia]